MTASPSSTLADDSPIGSPFSIDDVVVLVNGTEVLADEVTGPFSLEDKVNFTYSWSIADTVEITLGETINMSLPDVFAYAEIQGTLAGDDGFSYGDWKVLNGNLELIFSDLWGTQSAVSGGLEFTLSLEFQEIRIDEPYVLVIPIYGKTSRSFSLEFGPPEELESIAKLGSIDHDSDVITWTIDVNQDLAVIGDLKITDYLDGSLKLSEVLVGDVYKPVVSVYDLKVFSTGDVEVGAIIPGLEALSEAVYSIDADEPHELTSTFLKRQTKTQPSRMLTESFTKL